MRDQVTSSEQAALKHSAGTAGDPDVSRFQHLERDDCRVHEIPQFVDEEADALVAALRRFVLLERRARLAFTLIRGHRRRNRLVEAVVQRAEVIRTDRRIRFHGQFGIV